jgi:hypothetical protein
MPRITARKVSDIMSWSVMMEFVAKAAPFSPIRLRAAIGKMQEHWCPEPTVRSILQQPRWASFGFEGHQKA